MRLFVYVIREFFKYVLGSMLLSIFLFVLFDFIHKTTKYFAKYQPTTDLIVKLYIYQMPNHVIQAMPIAALIASVTTMVLLSRTNEVTAMRAAGMGPIRVGLPLALGGLMLTGFTYILSEVVLPRSSARLRYIEAVQIEKQKEAGGPDRSRWVRSGNTLFTYGSFDQNNTTLTQVKQIELQQSFRPRIISEAASAVYIPGSDIWRLEGMRRTFFKVNGTIEQVENVGFESMRLPIDMKNLRRDRREKREMGFAELIDRIEYGEERGEPVTEYKVDLHLKFAYPLAAFVVSLIGLKFGYKSERSTETAKGILLAFAIGISYWFVLNAGTALAKRGDVHPAFGAWLANFAVLAMIGFDLWREGKNDR